MSALFRFTDGDGDKVALDAFGDIVIIDTAPSDRLSGTMVELTRDVARDLAEKLTAWVGVAPPAPAPEFKVGDRVEIVNWDSRWDGPATVTDVWDASSLVGEGYSVHPDGAPRYRVGLFDPQHIRPYAPDYAALAAEFKPGDLAIVGDNPSTKPEPGGGHVSPEYAGKTVSVVEAAWHDAVRVQLHDRRPQWIHVAHLTRAKAVPA